MKDILIGFQPHLKEDDVLITSSGTTGEDLVLSPRAREVYPIQIECKNHATFAVYSHYDQAVGHGPFNPVLVVKANHREPLAIVDASLFFTLLGERYSLTEYILKGNHESNNKSTLSNEGGRNGS